MIRQEILQFVRKASMKRLKRAILSFLIVLGLVSIVVSGLGGEAQAATKDKSIAGEWGLTAFGFNVPPATTTDPEPVIGVGTFTFSPAVDGVGDCTLLIRVNATGTLSTAAGDCEYDLDPDGTGIGEITVPGFPLSLRFVVVDNNNEIRFSAEAPPGQIVSGVAKRQ